MSWRDSPLLNPKDGADLAMLMVICALALLGLGSIVLLAVAGIYYLATGHAM